MSCKCCAGPCRKKRVKRKAGAKKPQSKKQPTISINLSPSMTSKMPGLAPTFQSSVSTPLSEQRAIPPVATGARRIAREIETQTEPPTREIETQTEPPTRQEMGSQTVQLAGRVSVEEIRRYSNERLPGETVSEYRIRTYQNFY